MKKLFLFLPLILMVELVFGGPGFWMIGSGISLRKTLFALSLFTLYSYVLLSKNWILNARDFVVMNFISSTIVIWVLLIPTLYGKPLSFAFQDGGSVLFLLLYFPLAQLVRSGEIDWAKVKGFFVALVFILALGQVVIWFTATLFPSLGLDIRVAAINFFNAWNCGSIFVGFMPDGFYRVMWISSLYLIPALFFVLSMPHKKFWDYVKLFIFLGAIYVSYTRAMWIGILVGSFLLIFQRMLVYVLIRKQIFVSRGKILFFVLLSLTVFLVACFSLDSIEESFLMGRLFNLINDDGLSIRIDQYFSLMNTWMENMLMGTGFGGHAKLIRSYRAPFSYELTGAALLMKLGLVGISFWNLTVIVILVSGWTSAYKQKNLRPMNYLISSFIAFIIPAMTNPYLMNFVGISILLLLLLELDYMSKENPFGIINNHS